MRQKLTILWTLILSSALSCPARMVLGRVDTITTRCIMYIRGISRIYITRGDTEHITLHTTVHVRSTVVSPTEHYLQLLSDTAQPAIGQPSTMPTHCALGDGTAPSPVETSPANQSTLGLPLATTLTLKAPSPMILLYPSGLALETQVPCVLPSVCHVFTPILLLH